VELRRINEFYAQQRTAAKGNAGALLAVNKAYDAEIAQFNKGGGAGAVRTTHGLCGRGLGSAAPR